MIHFKIIFLGVVALSLSACVTSSSPDDLGKLVYTGFVERSDGTAYHKSMGVSCPETVGGMARTSTHVYNDTGTDISCNYGGGGRVFTIYLSQFPQYDLRQIFQGARAAIESRFSEQGYEYDETLSDSCSSETLDASSLLSGLAGLLSGETKNNEITLSPSPSAVYTLDSDMTLVIVDEMFDQEFFKIRYTGPYEGDASVEAICKLARDIYLTVEMTVRDERGLALQNSEVLVDVINASKGP